MLECESRFPVAGPGLLGRVFVRASCVRVDCGIYAIYARCLRVSVLLRELTLVLQKLPIVSLSCSSTSRPVHPTQGGFMKFMRKLRVPVSRDQPTSGPGFIKITLLLYSV